MFNNCALNDVMIVFLLQYNSGMDDSNRSTDLPASETEHNERYKYIKSDFFQQRVYK
jgi:hypothetical protein